MRRPSYGRSKLRAHAPSGPAGPIAAAAVPMKMLIEAGSMTHTGLCLSRTSTPSTGLGSSVGIPRPALQALPALQTGAQPLRFLDFLIYEPEPAAILHSAGVYVHVPAPERYAVHKLIVSRRRHEGAAKRDKDLQQAEALLEALAAKRPHELKFVWEEANNRGPRWRKFLEKGLSQIAPQIRDLLLRTVGGRRAAIPGIDLTFNNPPPRYDFGRDVVTFAGEALGKPVAAAISLFRGKRLRTGGKGSEVSRKPHHN
jgi:hypothetical protein